MNHKQAFLEAIRDTPDDDAPRLIYADWLEEQGGAGRTARAAFIRIQWPRHELPEDAQLRADRLEDEAADLVMEHEDEWTQPLQGIAEDWRFSRGFIEHLLIRGNVFSYKRRTPVRVRSFTFTPIANPSQRCPAPGSMSSASADISSRLHHCQFTDRALQQLLPSAHLERLTALNLSGNDINTSGLRALVQSPVFARLKRLDLSRNLAIGDTAVQLLAQANPKNSLEVLKFGRSQFRLTRFVGFVPAQFAFSLDRSQRREPSSPVDSVCDMEAHTGRLENPSTIL